MQEGILALMQLPKTIAALDELHEARAAALLRAHRIRRPAGVMASFASLGDVTIAEPARCSRSRARASCRR